jgi:hypothetical protein
MFASPATNRSARRIAGLTLAALTAAVAVACTAPAMPAGTTTPETSVVLGPAVSVTRETSTTVAGGPEPTTVVGPAVSIEREPTTTTTTTVAVKGAAVDADRVVLRGDGLGVARFDQTEDKVLPALEAALGAADFDSGWDQGVRSLNFGLLYVELHEVEGLRLLAGAYYTLPGASGPGTTPALDTEAPLGLGTGEPVTYGAFAASGTPTAPNPDHAGATCVTAPGGALCAYVDAPVVDGDGANATPPADARVVAVVLGRIRPFGHCT